MDSKIVQHYKVYSDVYYTGALGLFESWGHNARDKSESIESQSSILDIGGGDGRHVSYLSRQFSSYTKVDLLDDSTKLNPSISGGDLPKVNFVVGNSEKFPLENDSFDRVILTRLLHNADSPTNVLRKCRRVFRIGGLLSLYLPNNPGMVYRWIRHFGAHKKYSTQTKRPIAGVNYLGAIKDQNHALYVSVIIKNISQGNSVRRRSYPLPFRSWSLDLFHVYQISISKVKDE